jgi:predicted dithiol-disulfide oxidoreductase (DUF899 family)
MPAGIPENAPPVVSPQEWETARRALLVKEKELTRARDALAAERRRMPWTPVEKTYAFEGPDGPVTLLDLFQGAASSSSTASSTSRASPAGPRRGASAAR